MRVCRAIYEYVKYHDKVNEERYFLEKLHNFKIVFNYLRFYAILVLLFGYDVLQEVKS